MARAETTGTGSGAAASSGRAGEPRAVAESVSEVVELDERERRKTGLSEGIAHKITLFSGSMVFVWLHAAWFVIWIIINTPGLGWAPFDRFPFTFLTMIVSLEAIFLSTFVLITQNQQSRESDRRAKTDLEINMIAEREITESLKMLAAIQRRLGIENGHDRDLNEMQQQTPVQRLADKTEAAESEQT